MTPYIRLALLIVLNASAVALAQSDPPSGHAESVGEKIRALHWIKGPTTVAVDGNSKLVIPEHYVFLDAANTGKFEELLQNLGGGREVMVAPDTLAWTAYLEFSAEGYVKDNEKIDAPALLKTLKENTESANEERRKRGWEAMHVVDWARTPAYNPATRRLEWATLLATDSARSANFSTKILGRRGYTTLIMAADPADLDVAVKDLNGVLGGYSFNPGERYQEWREGDKVAEYGLGALIVGGAAAVAAKKGLFGVIATFLAAAWKFIAALVVAGLASLKKLFRKSS